MGDADGASALQQFCLLAKSAKGAACTSLITQALEHQGVFVFGELLDMPCVKELAGTSSAPSLELLKLFAYGTWTDYKRQAAQLPALSEAAATKLKMLSVVTLSTKSKIIAYDVLMRELEISSVREVEDLLIRCIYGELLNGKLDQQLKQLDVHTCIGRDIHPSEIATMLETLSQWHDTSLAVLGSLHDNIGLYKTQCEEARNAQSALTKKVDEVKATLRAQQDAGDAMRDDFEGGMDYDDDKMRKSGRAKLKHGLGVAPRGGSHR